MIVIGPVNKSVRRNLLTPVVLHAKCQNNKNLLSNILTQEVSFQQEGEISTSNNKMFCLPTIICEYYMMLHFDFRIILIILMIYIYNS